MSSTDPTTTGVLQRLDAACQTLAETLQMLRDTSAASPLIADLVNMRTLVVAISDSLAGVNMRMIDAARSRYRYQAQHGALPQARVRAHNRADRCYRHCLARIRLCNRLTDEGIRQVTDRLAVSNPSPPSRRE